MGKEIQALLDRANIIETVNSYGMGVDTRNFEWFRSLFTDTVEVDYTDMLGGEPYTITADELVKNWEALLTSFESTQHIIANHVVNIDGDTATTHAHFQAHHILINRKGGTSWTVAGYYVHKLVRTEEGWKINYVQLKNLWGEGNFDLVNMAYQLAQEKLEG